MTEAPHNPDVTVEAAAATLPGSFQGDLGIELLAIENHHISGRLIIGRRHLHRGGHVHAGVWVALADTVAAWGTLRNLRPEQSFTTIELKMNLFARAAEGDELLAEGKPLHRGGSTQVWEVRVTRSGVALANFICTQIVLDPR